MTQSTLDDFESSGVQCPVCKASFNSNKGFGPHFRAAHPDKHAATERVRDAYGGDPKDALIEWHHERGLTTREIEDRFNIPRDGLREVFKRCNVRTLGGEVPYTSYRTTHRGYEAWRCMIDGSQRTMKVHRLLAVAEFGIEAVKDMEVHHENGISWDNRPENIDIVEPGKHQRIHYDEREIDEKGRFK